MMSALYFISQHWSGTFLDYQGWVALTVIAYITFGWLFGNYTVLRWRKLPPLAVGRRVLIAAVFTFVIISLARVILNPSDAVWIVHRKTQLSWLGLTALCSLFIRFFLRAGLLLPSPAALVFVSESPDRQEAINAIWNAGSLQPLQDIQHVSLEAAKLINPPVTYVVDPSTYHDYSSLSNELFARDPRYTKVITLLSLMERQRERLPPELLPLSWIDYDELPWNNEFSFERQLKRFADIVVSFSLLLLTSPVLLLALLLIWIEDRGPVFYVQKRSGWLGQPFSVFKLRTMRVASPADQPSWTIHRDPRITRIGGLLRRFRLDELPQLLNVLLGDMSLIGPRPERPEFEQELDACIPHYRKRHWMRPGLSGWAQVCSPYAASVEDSELKLSYDLYYLKHFSTWLDLIILFRTIKTVLKAGGR